MDTATPNPETATQTDTQVATQAEGSLLTGQGAPETAEQAKPEEAKPETAEQPPEKYEFTLPEGVEMDAEILGEFEPVAKELGLTQVGAQKLVDLQVKAMQKLQAQAEARQEESFRQVTTQWANDARNDKEYGGAQFTENLQVAQKALKQFASPDLIAYLNGSGLGNHPEVIRTFIRIGKSISEDQYHAGGQGGARASDPAKTIYPNMN